MRNNKKVYEMLQNASFTAFYETVPGRAEVIVSSLCSVYILHIRSISCVASYIPQCAADISPIYSKLYVPCAEDISSIYKQIFK